MKNMRREGEDRRGRRNGKDELWRTSTQKKKDTGHHDISKQEIRHAVGGGVGSADGKMI